MINPRNEDGSINVEGFSPLSAKIHVNDIMRTDKVDNGAQGSIFVVYTSTIGVCALKEFFVPKDHPTKKDIETLLKSRHRDIRYSSEVDNHPNILKFYGYAVDDRSIIGILTEYMPNRSLKYHFDNDSVMTPYNILNWSLQIARALSYCHEVQGIIHRDIKPENVLLSQDCMTVKLCDFGLSRPVDGGNMTNLIGTLNYMAPEVMDSEGNRDYNFKADVWSYGMFIYAVTHRHHPFFKLETNFVTFRRRLVDKKERPVVVESTKIHYLLYIVMSQCWELEPQKRPVMIEIVKMLNEAILHWGI